MQLTDIASQKVKENRRCINKIAIEMDVHADTAERWVKENKQNGPLTTATALNIISKETGISKNNILTK